MSLEANGGKVEANAVKVERLGLNIDIERHAAPHNEHTVRKLRTQQGLCADCANQTFKRTGILGKLEPLTMPGKVDNGTCTRPDCPARQRQAAAHVTENNAATPTAQPVAAETTVQVQDDDHETIVKYMTRQPDLVDFQEECCRNLQELCKHDKSKRIAIASCGGIEAVLNSMRLYAADGFVQRHGCAVLAYLAEENHDIRQSIVDATGIDAVIDAMQRHKTMSDVQFQGCRVLVHLSEHDGSARKQIVAIGGVDAVIGCMKRKSSEEGIQECACVVLRNLAMDTANIAPIMEGGGLDTVVKAMKLHATIPSLQNRCFVHSRF